MYQTSVSTIWESVRVTQKGGSFFQKGWVGQEKMRSHFSIRATTTEGTDGLPKV